MAEETEFFRGIIPIVHNISEAEILDEINKYRKLYPLDERTDEMLRHLAISTVLENRKQP
jgi:hypothetical protein